MPPRHRTAIVLLIAITASALPFTAAAAEAASAAAPPGAALRVLHLSPDAPAVDVWLDGERAITNLSYGIATRYLRISSGEHEIALVPTGATAPIVIAAVVNLDARTTYTLAAIGPLADIGALLLDDTTRPSGRDAHLRFVHAAADAPAVDIATPGGAPIFANVSYNNVTDYTPLPRGTYDLEARLAGTDTVALSQEDIMLRGRHAYTAWAVGLLADGTLDIVLVPDAGRQR